MEATIQTPIVVIPTKSVGLALVLSGLFGPLGMLYSTILGAVIMFLLNIVAIFITLGIGLILTWPIGIVWAGLAARSHNKKLLAAGTA